MTAAPVSTLTRRTQRAQEKARVLREALPWMTRWAGRTVVVKYGGNALSAAGIARAGPARGVADAERAERAALARFAADVALLARVGVRVVVVHGGGPQISALAARLGLATSFVDGLRVTDAATLAAVRMALVGEVSPRLVGALVAEGADAAGVAGTDGGLLTLRPAADARLGLVGEAAAVDPHLLLTLLDQGTVPVVAPLGRDAAGVERNCNADAAAGAVATALQADKLIYLSNVPGLYRHFGASDEALLSTVTLARLRAMLAAGELSEGMVPKIASAVAALEGGVGQAHLLDGRIEHALLLEVFTDEGIGTMITAEEAA